MIFKKEIAVGDKTVRVNLLRPNRERFKTLAHDTVSEHYCLFAETECEGVKAPLYSLTIPRAQCANPERFQELLDEGMLYAARECALLVGAQESIMGLPEG